ncbi:hypothetical protein F5Y04DRAFT_261417 [Hypomontagnella monticulosa]|nr:hypothetical protein F5Y04DRAFT_261417 [Hypomontagnella monticulosa]
MRSRDGSKAAAEAKAACSSLVLATYLVLTTDIPLYLCTGVWGFDLPHSLCRIVLLFAMPFFFRVLTSTSHFSSADDFSGDRDCILLRMYSTA